jgi:ribosome biogenesis GTPase
MSEFQLETLGWAPYLQQQLTMDELEAPDVYQPARVFAVQRTGLELRFAGGILEIPLGGRWFQLPVEDRPTVGDWVLMDPSNQQIHRLLERRSLLKRMSVSRVGDLQLIAANVDVMFLVSSCNDEFNPARMERYLSLALDAGVLPVVVLTKADLAEDAEAFRQETLKLKRDLVVELVNALNPEDLSGLATWIQPGQTISLLGSSGVGKSTLINSLLGEAVQLTSGIREHDAKGRHTTTNRSLHLLPRGGLMLDSPGMRELGIADAEAGVASMFDDVEALAAECRFSDCEHESEPGCAVREAIETGALDERRLDSYRKLKREDLYNSETVAERHSRVRQFSKTIRQRLKTVDKRQSD